jgi:hypothetical protein
MTNREDRTSDYVCIPCGIAHLSKEQLAGEGGAHTAHISECGLCGKKDMVLHIRHYNWLYKPKTEKDDKSNTELS